MGITRKEIRKTLKKWVYREKTDYNHIWATFVDIQIGGESMSNQFESLVDEVHNLSENHYKELIEALRPFAEVGASVEGNEFNMFMDKTERRLYEAGSKKLRTRQ